MTAERTPLRLVPAEPPAATPEPLRPLLEATLRLAGAERGALVTRAAGDARSHALGSGLSPEEEQACRSLARRLWATPGGAPSLSSPLGGGRLVGYRIALEEREAALVLIAAGPLHALTERSSPPSDALVLLGAAMAAQDQRDAAAARAAHERLHSERLLALNRALQALAGPDDLERGCARLLADLRALLSGIDLAAIWLPARCGDGVELFVSDGDWGDDAHATHLPAGAGFHATEALLSGELREVQFAARGGSAADRAARRYGIRSAICVPLRSRQPASGVLTLSARARRTFDDEERAFLAMLGAQLGAQIDAQRQLEAAADERERLSAVLDALPVGIAMFEPDGRLARHNHLVEEIWGHPPVDAPIERSNEAYGLLLPDGRPLPAAESPLARALDGRGGPDAGQELIVRRAPGNDLPVLIHAAALRDRDGRPTGIITVYQDISQLREVDRLKDTFINTVSHELRTPITTVRGGARTLLRLGDQLDEPSRKQMLRDIAEETERLWRLLEDLLWMTRADAGVRLPSEPVIPHRFINKVISEMGGQIGNHALTVEVPKDLPLIEAVPACLEHVLHNLLENAVKFSPRGRRIEITAKDEPAHPGAVTFSVLDRGSGIPAQDMDRVFEPFYRAEEAVRTGSQGAGLGLTVCRRLMQIQGGEIWAETRSGGGAAFRFTLPAVAAVGE